MGLKQVSLVERSSLSRRVPYGRVPLYKPSPFIAVLNFLASSSALNGEWGLTVPLIGTWGKYNYIIMMSDLRISEAN